MCNIDKRLEQQIVAMGLNLIGQAMEASLREQNYSNSDVLSTATTAYQQGKITKSQFMAVINALDNAEQEQKAYSTNWTRNTDEAFHQLCLAEQREAQNHLNQYRR